MRILLVANPAAGSGMDVEEVRHLLRDGGAEVEALPVTRLGDPDRPAVADVDVGAADRLVVAGGDGSIGLAAALGARSGLPLAVVPIGTANDFARAMDLPLDPADAVRLAVDGRAATRAADLAWAGGRPFVNAASAGLSPRAAREARPLKRRLGHLAYAAGALRAAASARPLPCTVDVDGGRLFSGRAWQVTVAGTGAFGGGSSTGGTHPSDGRLDVAVVPGGPRRRLWRRAYGMRTGRLVEQDDVRHGRGAVVEVQAPDSTPFNVDGEVCRPLPCRFEVQARAFSVVVPG